MFQLKILFANKSTQNGCPKPKKGKQILHLISKEKTEKYVKNSQKLQPQSSDLAKLMAIAIENLWLAENSVLYALLTDTLTSLKKQEEEFAKHGKLTKNKKTTP